jgi:hypothetical protein
MSSMIDFLPFVARFTCASSPWIKQFSPTSFRTIQVPRGPWPLFTCAAPRASGQLLYKASVDAHSKAELFELVADWHSKHSQLCCLGWFEAISEIASWTLQSLVVIYNTADFH